MDQETFDELDDIETEITSFASRFEDVKEEIDVLMSDLEVLHLRFAKILDDVTEFTGDE